jgi:hypothetical protein
MSLEIFVFNAGPLMLGWICNEMYAESMEMWVRITSADENFSFGESPATLFIR